MAAHKLSEKEIDEALQDYEADERAANQSITSDYDDSLESLYFDEYEAKKKKMTTYDNLTRNDMSFDTDNHFYDDVWLAMVDDPDW